MSILEDRLAEFDALELHSGAHEPDHTFCVMEAVAYVAGEPWTDSPACVSPVIATFMRSWNDSLSDTDRQMLKPYISKVIGTKGSARDEEKRARMCTDWLARECAPAWLRLAGLTEHAETLEKLAPLTTSKRAQAAQPKLAAARDAAGAAAWAAAGAAAWDAARDAAWAAAGAAARAAAWDAARDAAWAAAGAAARAAARDAAGAAARDAAWAAASKSLQPTVKALQVSALGLLDRMIAVHPGRKEAL